MNVACFAGEICYKPVYSHTVFGKELFECHIRSERLSGTKDSIKCIIPENLVQEFFENEKLEVQGSLRTRMNDGKLDTFVFTESVLEYTEDKNTLEICGVICSGVTYRTTPLGRKISDVMVAVKRDHSSKCDYVPCICWGNNATRIDGLPNGTELKMKGRIQSREYTKHFDDESIEIRTVRELSVSNVAIRRIEDGI